MPQNPAQTSSGAPGQTPSARAYGDSGLDDLHNADDGASQNNGFSNGESNGDGGISFGGGSPGGGGGPAPGSVGDIFGGSGADALTGTAGTDRFVYKALTDSLVSGFDTITNFSASDVFVIGHSLSGFSSYKHKAGKSLASDLAATLSSGAFSKTGNGAALVTLTGTGADAGVYVVINDARAGFQAGSDAVVKLVGAPTVTATNFVV